MEKTVVFFPIIVFFSIFGVLIILFLSFVFKLIKKQKDSSWTGEVIDKKHNQVPDIDSDDMQDIYYIVVKLDNGKEIKSGLSSFSFNDFQIGDRVEKKKGELYPKKILNS